MPADATAAAVNLTAVQPSAAGDLRLFPSGITPPLASSINFGAGQTRANNAILGLAGPNPGSLDVQTAMTGPGTMHFVLDVTGYFKGLASNCGFDRCCGKLPVVSVQRDGRTHRKDLDLNGGVLRQFAQRLVLILGLVGLVALAVPLLLRLRVAATEKAQADELYSPAYGRLLDSLGATRPIEARLSGWRAYQPYRRSPANRRDSAKTGPHTRGAGLSRPSGVPAAPIPPEVGRAIRTAAERRPSPENLAAQAVLNLLEGDAGAAAEGLRKALARRPADMRLLNDFAAASLTRFEMTGDLKPAFETLEAVERSEQPRPPPPMLFNEALTLERLGLRSRAIAAWRRYLGEDARSGWAREAAGRLDALERAAHAGQVVARLLASPETERQARGRNPWADRQFGERTLLPRCAERALAGDRAGTEAALDSVEHLASALPDGGGRLLVASAAAIRKAQRAGDRARLARLAGGHRAYARAFRLRRSEHSAEAWALLGRAIDDLQAAGSPFELRARLLRIAVAREPDWAEIQYVERAASEAGFPSLIAEVRREAAYRSTLEGRFGPALELYEEAQRHFAALGESEMVAVLAAMRADLFEAIGNERLEMKELAEALAGAPAVSDPWNRYSIYVVAATAATSKFRRSAVELRREAGEVCRDLPERPLCAADSALWVARLTPDAEMAEDALNRAEHLLADVPDSEGKDRTAIDLTVTKAKWLAGEDRSIADQEKAAELYSEAVRRYQARGLVPSTAPARAGRAHVLERLGRSTEAAVEYREALLSFRLWDQTKRFKPENAEKRLPPELREIYEQLIGLEISTAGTAPSRAAFLLSEEMRDRLAPRRDLAFEVPRNADIDRWIGAVPAGTAIIEYALAGEHAAAWILAGERFEQVSLAPHPGFADLIRSLASERDLGAWKRRTSALYRELLSPLLTKLPAGTTRLVVIPDGDLYDLPFRALWDPASGRYLDEVFAIALAPSVRMALEKGLPPASAPGHDRISLLSIGFIAFAPDLGLDPLPRAAEEAASVKDAYGGDASSCQASDWESFRRCARQADVIHLATHASADSSLSGSWLALPEQTVTLDRLWRELPELPEHPLVVLSSCQSVAAAGGGEGLGGLARPFLASGAQAVLGTLWKIDDEYAAFLFSSFHHAYRRSGDPIEALREARDSLARWKEEPWLWGGVEILGRAVQTRKESKCPTRSAWSSKGSAHMSRKSHSSRKTRRRITGKPSRSRSDPSPCCYPIYDVRASHAYRKTHASISPTF